MASLFSGIEKAQISLGGNWLKPGGKYLCYISAVKMVTSRKKETFYTVELDMLDSSHPEIKPGMKCSWQANMKHDATMGNIKNFVASAYAMDPEKVTEGLTGDTVSAGNPLKGRVVEVVVVNIKTRANTDFSKHTWAPVAPEFQASAEELRKGAGF